MSKNIIKTKSFDFAEQIVLLYKVLIDREKEYVMSKQLLRSGTSIGANVREAEFARSRADFIHKMTISLKEANETDYWLDLLNKTGFLKKKEYIALKERIEEILRLLVSIVKTSKQ